MVLSGHASRLFSLIAADLEQVEDHLLRDVRGHDENLSAAMLHLLQAGGKRLRPSLVLLVGHAVAGRSDSHHRLLAEAVEMLHTATLIHDDVVDGAAVRRGLPSVNARWSDRVSVLVGDFLFARASQRIAQLDDTTIFSLFAEVVMKMSEGEIQQIYRHFEAAMDLAFYLEKTERKTALLFAASSYASARLSGAPAEVQQGLYQYGKHLGMAFQIADDILDVSAPADELGKPSGSDLAQGNLTAPVLLALEISPHAAELRELIGLRFNGGDGLSRAMAIINQPEILKQAQTLAYREAARACTCLEVLPPSEARDHLVGLTEYVVDRRN